MELRTRLAKSLIAESQRFIKLPLLVLFISVFADAKTNAQSWNGTTATFDGTTQDWNLSTNWSNPPTIPNGTGVTASVIGSFSADKTILLQQGITVGSLGFGHAGGGPGPHPRITIGSGVAGTLTFDGSGSTASLNSQGGTNTISANIVLTDNLNMNGTSGIILSGNISGSGSLQKLSLNNNVTLSGNNTFSGGINHTTGTIQLGGNQNSVLGTGAVTFASSGSNGSTTLGFSSAQSRTLSNNLINNNTGGNNVQISFLDGVEGNRIQTLSGAFTGGANSALVLEAQGGQTFSVANEGTIRLTGDWSGYNSTASSAIRIESGSVLIDSAASIANVGGYQLQANNAGAAGKLILGGAHTMANEVRFTGGSGGARNSFGSRNAASTTATLSGNVVLDDADGANLFSQNAGANLHVSGVVSSLSTSPLEINRSYTFTSADGVNSLQTPTGTVIFSNTNTYTGTTTISGGSLQIGNGGTTGRLSATSGIINNANLTINRSNAFSQATDLAGASISGTGSFTQAGTGTTTLTAANTYTGGTTVSAGKLVVGNTSGSGTGSGLVSVSSGAELVVSGTVAGAVNINAGGTLSGTGTIGGNAVIAGTHNPGNSPGIQTFNSDLTYLADSQFNWELIGNTTINAANPNAIFDSVVVIGNLDFAGATTLNLSFNGAGSSVLWSDAFWSESKLESDGWLLFNVTGTTTNLGNLNLSTTNWLDGSGNLFSAIRPGASFSLFQDRSNVFLNYQIAQIAAVPEPSSALLLAGGAALWAVYRRRQKRTSRACS